MVPEALDVGCSSIPVRFFESKLRNLQAKAHPRGPVAQGWQWSSSMPNLFGVHALDLAACGLPRYHGDPLRRSPAMLHPTRNVQLGMLRVWILVAVKDL